MPGRTDLVLLPGWSLPVTIFDGLLPLLEARYCVTCLPLPPAATLPEMAERLLAIAPPQASWCGFSLGGMVALQAALLEPARVASVLALATNLSFVARAGWPQAMAAAEFDVFAAGLDGRPEDNLAGAVDAGVAATLARFDALQCHGSSTARAERRTLRDLRSGSTTAGIDELRAGLAVLRASDLRAGIATLRCPVAWLLGSEDALVPAAVAADIRASLPQAGVTQIDGGSHLFFLQQPACVVDALEFLNSTGKSS